MDAQHEIRVRIRTKPEWLISFWLVTSGVYGLISSYGGMNKAGYFWLVAILIIHSLKIATGFSVWFGRSEAKYLMLPVLAWHFIVTLKGHFANPIWSESAYVLIYVAGAFSCYIAATVYLFAQARACGKNES